MKLTNFQTPTGQKGNLLNPNDWLSMILGVVVLLVTFAMGQNVANKVAGKASFVDAQPEQPWSNPQPQQTNPNKKAVI